MGESKDNGGPAFPQNDLSAYNMGPEGIGDGMGMSLRDWFAANMDRDEYGDQSFRHLSLNAKELLAGPRPEKPEDRAPREDRVAWQLAEMKWELRVRAAVRFIYADAMIVARKVSS